MKARLRKNGPAWRGYYRGHLGGQRAELHAGDEVEGADAKRLLNDYPQDFESVGESHGEKIVVGLNRMIHPEQYEDREMVAAEPMPARKRGRPPKRK